MAPRSKIQKLPDDVKNFIDKALKENKKTQMEVTQEACEMLKAQGFDEEAIFSVMSLNRYSKIYYRMIQTRQDAEQMYKMLSESNPEGDFDVNDAIVAQAKNLVAREMQKYVLGEYEFDAELLSKLTLISKRLSETQQKIQAISRQAKEEYRKEIERKLDEVTKGKKAGITQETAEAIKREILGINI